jgi:hypothetical protein
MRSEPRNRRTNVRMNDLYRAVDKVIPPDGVPCKHPGCMSHISHPCEGCGRTGGIRSHQQTRAHAIEVVKSWPSWKQDFKLFR